jgi:hypothetical protein
VSDGVFKWGEIQVETATLLAAAAQRMAATLDPGAVPVALRFSAGDSTFAAAADVSYGATAATAQVMGVVALEATPLGALQVKSEPLQCCESQRTAVEANVVLSRACGLWSRLQEFAGRVSGASVTTAAVALLPPALLSSRDASALGTPAAVAVSFKDPIETPDCISRTLLKPSDGLYYCRRRSAQTPPPSRAESHSWTCPPASSCRRERRWASAGWIPVASCKLCPAVRCTTLPPPPCPSR